ncbi:hypothetical protein GCM10009789_40400 [Kribbella sancticallisti]|uniref:Uncharacterized protein n=1 Tax=Kribbella sancticallisti TaxID=460087 RepID=A0ABN2DPR5_9ACTN
MEVSDQCRSPWGGLREIGLGAYLPALSRHQSVGLLTLADALPDRRQAAARYGVDVFADLDEVLRSPVPATGRRARGSSQSTAPKAGRTPRLAGTTPRRATADPCWVTMVRYWTMVTQRIT